MKIEHNYSLLKHNTFGINAKCQRFVEYESVKEAQEIVRSLKEDDYPLLILGGGTFYSLVISREPYSTLASLLSSKSTKNVYVVALLTYGMTL